MSEGIRGTHCSPGGDVTISQRAPPPVFLFILNREADGKLILFCDKPNINGIQNLILFPNSQWRNLWARFITLSSIFYFFLSLVFFTGLINSTSQQGNPVRFQLFLCLCNSIAARKQLLQCSFSFLSIPFLSFPFLSSYFIIFYNFQHHCVS